MTLAALTVQVVPIRVRSLLAARGADVSNLRNNRILALIDPALETMAYRLASGGDYLNLQKDYPNIEITGGVLELDDIDPAIIFDIARSVIRLGTTTLTPIDSFHTFAYASLPTGQVYYAQAGSTLHFKDENGARGSYEATLTVTANFIPTLAEVPAAYAGLFIQTLAGMLSETRPEARALEMSV